MYDVRNYTGLLVNELRNIFGKRLVYVGLQGSYLRGEETAESDIDTMVVIEDFGIDDMEKYRAVIESIKDKDYSVGFVCDKAALAEWNRLEINYLKHATLDIYGSLESLLPDYTDDDIIQYIKFSLNNLSHELTHRYIHQGRDKAFEAIEGPYKAAFFILQDMFYLRNKVFINSKAALVPHLEGDDREVLETAMALKNGKEIDRERAFALLFRWSKESLKNII